MRTLRVKYSSKSLNCFLFLRVTQFLGKQQSNTLLFSNLRSVTCFLLLLWFLTITGCSLFLGFPQICLLCFPPFGGFSNNIWLLFFLILGLPNNIFFISTFIPSRNSSGVSKCDPPRKQTLIGFYERMVIFFPYFGVDNADCWKGQKVSPMRMNCFIRKIIHNRPPTHDDLPVLLVVGHLVGAPQLAETATSDLKKWKPRYPCKKLIVTLFAQQNR